MDAVLPFVHPALGAAALLTMLWVGSRGLVARQGGPKAHALRRFHARWGNLAFAAMLVAAVSGAATVVWVREDLDLAASWHFWWGCAATASMALLAWLTPRRYRKVGAVRDGHPVLGALTLLLGVVVLVVGIGLLP